MAGTNRAGMGFLMGVAGALAVMAAFKAFPKLNPIRFIPTVAGGE